MPKALWTVTSRHTGRTYRAVPVEGDATGRRHVVLPEYARGERLRIGDLIRASDGSGWLVICTGHMLDCRANIGTALELLIEWREGKRTTLAWKGDLPKAEPKAPPAMVSVPREAADYALGFLQGFEDDDGTQEDMKGITTTIAQLQAALEGSPK